MVISPTIGRVVWYRPGDFDRTNSSMMINEGDQPMAALVAFVWSDTLVNLTVSDHNGVAHSRTSVVLHQGVGECRASPYCEWMPFQKGQAAKTEAAQEALRQAGIGASA